MSEEARAYEGVLEQHLEKLIETLHQWHGSPDTNPDVPDSLKEAMGEVARGETEEW